MPHRALSIPWIDSRRGRRVFELILVLLALSSADLFFTLWAHHFTQFNELNPIARSMLEAGAIGNLVMFKLSLTVIGALIFWKLRRDIRAEIGLWTIVGVYVMLTIRWGDYTAGVEPGTLAAEEPSIIWPLPQQKVPQLRSMPQIAPDQIMFEQTAVAMA